MIKCTLLSTLLIAQTVYSLDSLAKPSGVAFEWVEDFELDDQLNVKEEENTSDKFSADIEEYEFLSVIDFDLEELEEKPTESDITFTCAEPYTENEDVAIAELPNLLLFKENPSNLSAKRVSNREYAEFVNNTGHRVPSHWKQGKPAVGSEELPVVNISYKDAYLYAVWADKRLPTLQELQEQGDVIEDLSSSIGEWTATPAKVSSTVSGHFIFMNKELEPIAQENNKGNEQTSFRVLKNKG